MQLLFSHSVPRQLWLAAAPSEDGSIPGQQNSEKDVGQRSLRVLIVEDEFFISLHTKGLLQNLGHTVVAIAVTAEQGIALAEQEAPDLILMDIRLAGPRDGIDAAGEIFTRFGIGSIFVTANTDPQTRKRAEAVSPYGFLEKPLTEQRLKAGLSKVSI